MALSPELIDFLGEKQVVLVGGDTPSVDLADDENLIAHQTILKHDMAVLEGLVLDEVKPGIYTFIALPLKIMNADASPVRAILLGKGGGAR